MTEKLCLLLRGKVHPVIQQTIFRRNLLPPSSRQNNMTRRFPGSYPYSSAIPTLSVLLLFATSFHHFILILLNLLHFPTVADGQKRIFKKPFRITYSSNSSHLVGFTERFTGSPMLPNTSPLSPPATISSISSRFFPRFILVFSQHQCTRLPPAATPSRNGSLDRL